jgi:hypothetical protein
MDARSKLIRGALFPAWEFCKPTIRLEIACNNEMKGRVRSAPNPMTQYMVGQSYTVLYVGDTVNLCDLSHSPVSDVIEREARHNQPAVQFRHATSTVSFTYRNNGCGGFPSIGLTVGG